MYCILVVFFFFQAEDGIRDLTVTGVQTCALPICHAPHDQGVALPLLALLRRLPSRLPACGVPRQRHSAAVGEPGSGERPLPALGGVPHDRRRAWSERLADLGTARRRAVAPLLLSFEAGPRHSGGPPPPLRWGPPCARPPLPTGGRRRGGLIPPSPQ